MRPSRMAVRIRNDPLGITDGCTTKPETSDQRPHEIESLVGVNDSVWCEVHCFPNVNREKFVLLQFS